MRYAVYFTPEPESLFGELGRGWMAKADPLVDEPRRYGFHATLKAPFRLKPPFTERDLRHAVALLAEDLAAVEIGKLELSMHGGFLALRPMAWPQAAQALADECVVALDHMRAPLTESEIARRRRTALSPAEEASLMLYGYPYVLRTFHFHMTLSAPADAGRLRELAKEAESWFAVPLCERHIINRLTLLREPRPGDAFEIIGDFPLRDGGIWPELWKWSAA